MTVRGELGKGASRRAWEGGYKRQTPGEVRDATKRERHVCTPARDGERPPSYKFVDAAESKRRPCLYAEIAPGPEAYLNQHAEVTEKRS
jgi:hypothetical protein